MGCVAMVDLKKVRQVLRRQLQTVATLPTSDKRAWENRAFKLPDPPVAWVRENFWPASEIRKASKEVEVTGIYRVEVFMPVNSGTEAADDLAKAIIEVFPPASSLTYDSTNVAIDRSVRNPGRVDSGVWWIVAVDVTWRTYAQT